MVTPTHPRSTLPWAISSLLMCTAMLLGMANPMPSDPPDSEAIAVLIPMTSPYRLSKRTAAIARIDRSISLQEILVAARVGNAPAVFGADDAMGDGLVEASRVPDGHHPLPDICLIGIPELNVWEGSQSRQFGLLQDRSWDLLPPDVTEFPEKDCPLAITT